MSLHSLPDGQPFFVRNLLAPSRSGGLLNDSMTAKYAIYMLDNSTRSRRTILTSVRVIRTCSERLRPAPATHSTTRRAFGCISASANTRWCRRWPLSFCLALGGGVGSGKNVFYSNGRCFHHRNTEYEFRRYVRLQRSTSRIAKILNSIGFLLEVYWKIDLWSLMRTRPFVSAAWHAAPIGTIRHTHFFYSLPYFTSREGGLFGVIWWTRPWELCVTGIVCKAGVWSADCGVRRTTRPFSDSDTEHTAHRQTQWQRADREKK